MRTCYHCGLDLPISEFNKKGNGHQPNCRPCQSIIKKAWYKENGDRERANIYARREIKRGEARSFIWSYLKEHPCVDCGEGDPIVLEFDHVSGDKVNDVSEMVHRGNSIAKISLEINKCEVRCANCHKRVTAKRGDYWYTKM